MSKLQVVNADFADKKITIENMFFTYYTLNQLRYCNFFKILKFIPEKIGSVWFKNEKKHFEIKLSLKTKLNYTLNHICSHNYKMFIEFYQTIHSLFLKCIECIVYSLFSVAYNRDIFFSFFK
jgi:hypothetical protein